MTQEASSKWKAIYDRWAIHLDLRVVGFHVYWAARWEGASPMLDMNCTVCNVGNGILYPLAKHKSKEEALGMEVIIEDNLIIDEFDLTAGLFWEMTYYPFDN